MYGKPAKICAAIAALLTLHVSPAIAEGEYEKFSNPLYIYIGAFFPETSSDISINGDALPPIPPINVEDGLGVESSEVTGYAGINWRFLPRHSIDFEFFALNRTGDKSGNFDPPLQLGDFSIESGATSTDYDTSISRLTYGYSILRDERYDLQLQGGIHIAQLSAGVGLSGAVCTPDTTPSAPPGCPVGTTASVSEDVTAPLPHFGVTYGYAISPSVALNLRAIGFAIELDSIDGSIVELGADIGWQPFQNVGFGAGARYFRTKVEAGTSELNGSFKIEYLGGSAYIFVSF